MDNTSLPEKNQDNQDIAIRITDVSKEYRLGQIGGGTLQRDLQSWWAKKRGKEDPNCVIGSRKNCTGDRFLALDGISLTIKKGEAIGIIGRNGAGKSTLLKLLSRVTAPTAGVIELFGKVTSMLEVGTGFHPEMTGRENIYMNGAILGMTKPEIDACIEDIIDFSEVREFIDTPVKRYSSGMYVKLAFSVAVHLQSDIMIMDEVLAVGDMSFQAKCLKAMRKAASEEGRTVLYVSHNMHTIRQLCSRCIVLDSGHLLYDGLPEDAISVYMEQRRTSHVFLSYEHAVPPSWLLYQKIRLLEASYPGRTSNQFAKEEPAILRLIWENLDDVNNVCLRIEVRSADDLPQATFFLEDFYSGSKGERVSVDLELDLSPFADATYNTVYTFYQCLEMNGQAHLECCGGMNFEVITGKAKNEPAWEYRNWGYIRLNGIKALRIEPLHDKGS